MLTPVARFVRVLATCALALATYAAAAGAQVFLPPILDVGPSEDIERWRLSTIPDTTAAAGLLARSPSTLGFGRRRALALVAPRLSFVRNSALPFSMNDGWLWAGRGSNFSASAGVAITAWRFRLILAPELVHSANEFVARDRERFYAPEVPPDRSPYTLVWYTGGPFSADFPIRFGDRPITRGAPGQSSAAVTIKATEFGFATENHWWGPGFRNALILSNTAPGFPHLFFRSARPLSTRLGAVEFRWIVGGLKESPFFDTTTANDVRSLSATVVTLQPARARILTLGLARAVMGASTGWNEFPFRWLEVFHRVRPTNDLPLNDSTLYPGGREQVFSVFGRLRLPESGFDAHIEWGRTEFPRSPRDFLVAPNHTQAYTLGAQWRNSPDEKFWRIQAELTTLEQSATFRTRPLGVWYTSRRVIQGYTNRGQPLGAGIGPGSSSQWLAFDRFTPTSHVGVYGGRIRHNEDVRSIYPFPEYQAYCVHDINMYWGARASRETRAGRFTVDGTFGNRINLWFQVASGCPRGDAQRDVRNGTLSLTFEPFKRRWNTSPGTGR